jgi:cytidylate kinase
MDNNPRFFSRNISIEAYEKGPGSFLLRGTLTDERHLSYRLYLSGEMRGPGAIHNMVIEMEVSVPDLRIISADARMLSVPNEECRQIRDSIDRIVGLSIRRGFTRKVRDLLGESRGCLHLTNLVLTMGSTAPQALWALYSSFRKGQARTDQYRNLDAEQLINSCWVWRPDGPYAALLGKKPPVITPVITIDGPAGSGKSTIARLLASELGFTYLDTGAIYRAVALLAAEKGIAPEDGKSLAEVASGLKIELKGSTNGTRVVVDGRDISREIRDERISMLASTISALPEVRQALLPIQRSFARKGGVVCEGRDMGTVVFPDAELKIYLDADIAERARRRHLELASRGIAADYETIRDEIALRDKQDLGRGVAPLRVPEGALVINTTGLSIQEVTGAIMRHACNLRANGKQ